MAIIFTSINGFGFGFFSSSVTLGEQSYSPVPYNADNNALIQENDLLWEALPSFYNDLLQGKEVFEESWTAVRMLLGAEMLTLIQHAYNNSSKDINRYFQKKWQYLDFERKFDPVKNYTKFGPASYVVTNTLNRGLHDTAHGETIISADLENSQLSFIGDEYYSSEQSVADTTSLMWSISFRLSSTENSSFLAGYTKLENTLGANNSILAGVTKNSAGKYHLYVSHIDIAGNETFKTKPSFDIPADREYEIESSYDSDSRSIFVTLKEKNIQVYPSLVAKSFSVNFAEYLVTLPSGVVSWGRTGSPVSHGLSFVGPEREVSFVSGGVTYEGVLEKSGHLIVKSALVGSYSITHISLNAVDAIPVGVSGDQIYTNKFTFIGTSLPTAVKVGDRVYTYEDELVNVNHDGVLVKYTKSSLIKSIDTSTGVVTLDAAIISYEPTLNTTDYPQGVIPDLIYIESTSDLLIDVDGDGVKDTKVTLALDIIGLATDFKFTADSFGILSIANSRFRTNSKVDVLDWSYSWPVLKDYAQFIPTIRPNILNTTGELKEHLDYTVDGKNILLKSPNKGKYFAEYVAYDTYTLYHNFGVLLGLDKELSTKEYKAKVRALLYGLYNGPTIRALLSGFGLFFALPVAETAGVVKTVNTSYSIKTGQIIITESDGTDAVYYFPNVAGTSLSQGDSVEQFQLLANGVTLSDYINDPDTLSILGAGLPHAFGGIHELQKFHTFVLGVDLTKIDISLLPRAFAYVERIKPTYKKAIVLGTQAVSSSQEITDSILANLVLGSSESGQPTFVDYLCRGPNPTYDSDHYSGDFDYDYSYDPPEYDSGNDLLIDAAGNTVEFQPSAVPTDPALDFVSGSLLNASEDYTRLQLNKEYPFIDGLITLAAGNKSLTGAPSSIQANGHTLMPASTFTSELSSPPKHLIIRKAYTGSGATATQNTNMLIGSPGDFAGLEVGDYIWLGTLLDESGSLSVHDNGHFTINEVFSGDAQVELTHAFVNKPSSSSTTHTGIVWIGYKRVCTFIRVNSVASNNTGLINTNTPGDYAGTYLATLVDLNFVEMYYDNFDETCPNESVTMHFGSNGSFGGQTLSSPDHQGKNAPIGLSYPFIVNSTSIEPGVLGKSQNRNINYANSNDFHNLPSDQLTFNSATPDRITLNSGTNFTLGEIVAFPLLSTGLTANGQSNRAHVALGSETVTNTTNGGSAHNMGFSWHFVVSISGSYSASLPKLWPEISASNASFNGSLRVRLANISTASSAFRGKLYFKDNTNKVVIKYAQHVAATGNYPAGSSSTSYPNVEKGMFLLCVKDITTNSWSNTFPDMVIEIINSTHTSIGGNEFEVECRRWKTPHHAGIEITNQSSNGAANPYYFFCIDFTHPLMQDQNASSSMHATNFLACRKGMSEIYDKYSAAGAALNSSEVVTAASSPYTAGAFNKTLDESVPT